MAKFAFIGGGSFGFTRKLVRDILTFPAFADAEIALMDIDEERLDYIKRACEKIVKKGTTIELCLFLILMKNFLKTVDKQDFVCYNTFAVIKGRSARLLASNQAMYRKFAWT